MPESAESHSHSLTTNRNCVMELTNVTSNCYFINPRVYMESGFVYSPPEPTLRTTMKEVCSFTKDDNTASGAVGVLTYELFNMRTRSCSDMIAIMFSVPFDYNFYKNWLSVGIFDKSQACDEKLYNLMYKAKESTFVRREANGSGIVYNGKEVAVRACMSDGGKAIVKMEVYDKFG